MDTLNYALIGNRKLSQTRMLCRALWICTSRFSWKLTYSIGMSFQRRQAKFLTNKSNRMICVNFYALAFIDGNNT